MTEVTVASVGTKTATEPWYDDIRELDDATVEYVVHQSAGPDLLWRVGKRPPVSDG